MTDRIHIQDLILRCIIGVDEAERREKQDVIINAVLSTDVRKAAASDRFEEAVDYRAIKKQIVFAVEKSQFNLVEALADQVARICLQDPRVEEAHVTVGKPGALRFARCVTVELTRKRAETLHEVLVGIGSNIEPETNIPRALSLLGARAPVRAVSTFYRTPPEGRRDQRDFINGVAAVETPLPVDLLKETVLRAVESQVGRQRTADRYAPREIDLDALAIDGVVTEPDAARRAFVAVPLAELAPDLRVGDPPRRVRDVAGDLPRDGLSPLREFTDRLRRELALAPARAP